MLGWTPGQRPRPSPEGSRVASRSTQRRCRPAAYAADGQARTRSGEHRAVLYRSSPRRKRRSESAWAVRRSTSKRETGRMPSPTATGCRWTWRCSRFNHTRTTSGAACAHPRRCLTAHSHAHRHRRLGLPLAGRLSLYERDRAAARHHDLDAVHVRQLRREPSQPASSAGSRRVGPEHLERDGRPVDPGVPRSRRRSARSATMSSARNAPKILRATRRSCWPIPANPLRHDQVALLFLSAGQLDQAIVHLRDSLRLNASSAPTHYNLGSPCPCSGSSRRRLPNSARPSGWILSTPTRRTTRERCCTSWGGSGRRHRHYRRAIELRPDNADAHSNLGRLYTATGQDRAAADEFRRALALRQPITCPRWRGSPGSWRPAPTLASATRRKPLGRLNAPPS